MRIGIDLGGTKIEGALMTPSGELAERIRVPSPQDNYDATVAAIRDLVLEIEDKAGTECQVGVGIPGTICPVEKVVKNANSTWLIGHRFDQDLSTALDREIRLANDANCFALSEAIDGAAAGAKSVFGVILGTGCGGGYVVDGHLQTGVNAIAGEWGHCGLPRPKPNELEGHLCYCGKQGCIETFVSGTGFSAQFFKATGERKTATTIADNARAGDPTAKAQLGIYVDRLARALSLIVNILDPEIIVFGGGVSKIPELCTLIGPKLQDEIFSPTMRTRLLMPKYGDSSGVRGAAWLWPKSEDGAPAV